MSSVLSLRISNALPLFKSTQKKRNCLMCGHTNVEKSGLAAYFNVNGILAQRKSNEQHLNKSGAWPPMRDS
jgi:hypothetical protein